jgi:protein HIRA/HIR1
VCLYEGISLYPILCGGDVNISCISIASTGMPIITLSNRESFTFHKMKTWIKISGNQDLDHMSDFYANIDQKPDKFPWNVKLDNERVHKFLGEIVSGIDSRVNEQVTLSDIEDKMSTAIAMSNSEAYVKWLNVYARKLAGAGEQVIYKVEDLCRELCGPFTKDDNWVDSILGLKKRKLLSDILPILAHERKFQRILGNFQEFLINQKECSSKFLSQYFF